MNHFKGHEQAGFGGALKNLGMGSASIAGKLELHSSSKPVIDTDSCRGCNMCVKNCAHDAVHLIEHKAVINYDNCVGCGQCVAVCQFEGAILKDWDTTDVLCCKIAEYAKAVVADKPNFHISFIMDVSPECDCWCHNDAPLLPNIGILASFDPVALDQACADLAMQAPKIVYNNRLDDLHFEESEHHQDDVFHIVHPNTDWRFGQTHGEKIGLGTTEYEMVTV